MLKLVKVFMLFSTASDNQNLEKVFYNGNYAGKKQTYSKPHLLTAFKEQSIKI